jgi:hypothetical protein
MGCNPFSLCWVQELPVFKPNDYFFKHHLRDGEEKWECYSRIIREIMSKNLGIRLSDQSFKHKVEYRTKVFGSKKHATD